MLRAVYRDDAEGLRTRVELLERRLAEARAVEEAADGERRRLVRELAFLRKLWEIERPSTTRLWPVIFGIVMGLTAIATIAALSVRP
jgi:hypothetical protein